MKSHRFPRVSRSAGAGGPCAGLILLAAALSVTASPAAGRDPAGAAADLPVPVRLVVFEEFMRPG